MARHRMRGAWQQNIMGRGSNPYFARVMATEPMSYWPLQETSGSVAVNRRNAFMTGAYVGPTLAGDVFLDGRPCPTFDDGDWVNIYTTALRDAFNGNVGGVAIWAKPGTGAFTDGVDRRAINLYADGANSVSMGKYSTENTLLLRQEAGNVVGGYYPGMEGVAWIHLAITWGVAGVKTYLNGSLIASSALTAWDMGAVLQSTTAVIGATSTGGNTWVGSLAHAVIWAGMQPTAAQIATLHDSAAAYNGLFALGDSKTGLTGSNSWPLLLASRLGTATGVRWVECPVRYGVPGYTMAQMATYVTANLGAITRTATNCTINLGANDVASLPAEATWKASLVSVIDSLRAKWPTSKSYIALPWRRNYAAECNTLAGWITDVIALYGSGVYVGPDERVWLENGDDGATYTSDGIHYTAGAQTVAAAQWLTAMGY